MPSVWSLNMAVLRVLSEQPIMLISRLCETGRLMRIMFMSTSPGKPHRALVMET
jgi:hypothetical protein